MKVHSSSGRQEPECGEQCPHHFPDAVELVIATQRIWLACIAFLFLHGITDFKVLASLFSFK